MIEQVLVLPTPRALLPPYSAQDPVRDLRTAAAEAMTRLLHSGPQQVYVLAPPVSTANRARGVTEPLGHRVARHLLDGRGPAPQECVTGPGTVEALRTVAGAAALLVMADGSAARDERAPGHLHPAAASFDSAVEQALRSGDVAGLAGLDPALATEVWCEGVPALHALAEVCRGYQVQAEVTYAEAPYGVAWWVARWQLTG